MADTFQCAHCGSTHTQHGFDTLQCLYCGNRTDFTTGAALPVEPSFSAEYGRRERP